jgi:hypothetical protein
MTETCWWLLCNKITFIYSSAFVALFKNLIHLINAWNMEHIKKEVQDLETVNSFTQLETELTKGYEEEVEIQKRIMSANKAYRSLLHITKP